MVELGRQLTPFRMMRARLAIEPAIAREAAVNASGETLRKMQLAIERAKAATTWKDYEIQDDVFHRTWWPRRATTCCCWRCSTS